MKKYCIALLVIISLVSCKDDSKTTKSPEVIEEEIIVGGFRINGTIMNSNGSEISLYQIHPNDSLKLITSTSVKNNQFKFTGKVIHPDFYLLRMDSERECKILLENNTLDVFLSKKNFKHEISSTATLSQEYEVLHEKLNTINTNEQLLHDQYEEYVKANDSKQIEKLNLKLTEITNSKKITIVDFIKQTSEKSLSVLVLKDYIELLDIETVKESFGTLPIALQNDETGQFITDFIKKKAAEKPVVVVKPKKKPVKKKVEFRPQAYAISGKTQEGTEMSLASISQGKVVLIDFWASWCQPCRVQSPHIVSMYKKYKSRGLEILSVSEDTNEAAWANAIVADQFSWDTHIIDNNKSIAFRYGIEAIPHTILIDKNGKIAAEKLSGSRLEAKIKQLLNE